VVDGGAPDVAASAVGDPISTTVSPHIAALTRFTHTAVLKRRPLCSCSQPASVRLAPSQVNRDHQHAQGVFQLPVLRGAGEEVKRAKTVRVQRFGAPGRGRGQEALSLQDAVAGQRRTCEAPNGEKARLLLAQALNA
jgi:hypothetical protein